MKEKHMGMVDELEKLSSLHAAGRLSDDEYAAAKARVLRGATVLSTANDAATSVLARLTRSRSQKWFGGVAGGLATLTDVPAWAWRIFFVLTAFLHGLGILIYLLMWIFVPLEREALPVAPTPSVPPATPSP
jgi:phage shock protein C